MIVVTVDGSIVALVVCPWDIAHGILAICNLIAIYHLAHTVNITTATDFIPWIIRKSVAVYIFRNHHNTCLVHSSKHQILHFLIGVTPDGKITLTWYIGNRMIEMEGDISTPASESYQMCISIKNAFACNVLVTLTNHVGLSITSFIFWNIVDVLSWGRAIFVNGLDVLRMYSQIVHALGFCSE